jgi:hypothetical protein
MSAAWPAVLTQINPADYYATTQMHKYKDVIGNFPGAVLVEGTMESVVRYAAYGALFVTPLRFWIAYRRTLSPAKREELLMRNYALDHLAAAGCASFFGGLGLGVAEHAYRYGTDIDAVAAQAVFLRADKTHDRWARTFAKAFICTVAYCVVFVDRNPALWYRFGLGVSTGALLSSAVSVSSFDLAMMNMNMG